MMVAKKNRLVFFKMDQLGTCHSIDSQDLYFLLSGLIEVAHSFPL